MNRWRIGLFAALAAATSAWVGMVHDLLAADLLVAAAALTSGLSALAGDTSKKIFDVNDGPH